MEKHFSTGHFAANQSGTNLAADASQINLSTRSRDRWLCHVALIGALLLGVLALFTTVSAATSGSSDDDAHADVSLAPYFQVKGAEPGVDALPLKSTQVDAVLAGVIAQVRVVQTYQNEGATPLEARYIFPGSTRAAVHGMTMTVGERRIEAQIKEKEEARKTYEAAKREGKTASLLESHRSNIFEMNVANILPGDTVTVELRYNELVTPEDGQYEWVFPTVVGPRYTRANAKTKTTASGNAANENGKSEIPNPLAGMKRMGVHAEGVPYLRPQKVGDVEGTDSDEADASEPVFTMTVDIVSGSRVRKVQSTTHRIEMADIAGVLGGGAVSTGVRVTLPPSHEKAMNRDFILRYKLAGDALAGGLMIDEYKGEKYFLLTVQPPARVEASLVPARDYVFVMDVSGSMWGFPLDVSTKLLKELLLNLRAQDTFNVLLFSGSSRSMFDKPMAATPENIAAALEAFEAGRKYNDYGGGTDLLPALERALALPTRGGVSRSIVVMTDGYVDVEAEAYALVRENLGKANLFAFGIGSSVNRELIERLARAGRSESTIIIDEKHAVSGAEKFRKMIEAPVLTHVRAEFEDFAVVNGDVIPQVQPDVLAQRPLIMTGKWSGDATKGVIRLSGETGAGAWSTEVRLADAVDLGGKGTLGLLWARERLWELKDLHAQRVEPVKQKAAIVDLGLKYNLLTPYTSFVAVDMTPRISSEAAAQAKKVSQASPLPKGVGENAVGASGGEDDADGIPTSPEPETIGLLVVAAMVAGVVWWRKRGERRDREGKLKGIA